MSRRPVEAASPTGWSKATHIFLSSSVHGLLQTRILEWVAIPFSRVASQPSDQTQISCTAGRLCIIWATRKALFPPLLFKWRHWPSSLRLPPLASPETAPPSSLSLLMSSMHLNVYKSLLSLRNNPPQVHYFPPAPSTSLWSLSKLSFFNESSGFSPFQLTAFLKPLQFQPSYPLGVSAGYTFFSCSLVHAITEVLVQPSTLCVQNASPGSKTPSHFKEKLFGNDIRNDIDTMEDVFRGEGQWYWILQREYVLCGTEVSTHGIGWSYSWVSGNLFKVL